MSARTIEWLMVLGDPNAENAIGLIEQLQADLDAAREHAAAVEADAEKLAGLLRKAGEYLVWTNEDGNYIGLDMLVPFLASIDAALAAPGRVAPGEGGAGA